MHRRSRPVHDATSAPRPAPGFAVIAGVLRRRTLLEIGSAGVLLGRDEAGRPDVVVPWTDLDMVVVFRGKPRWHDRRLQQYVGVVRGDLIVAYRRLEGGGLDRARAAAAVARFGGGRPCLEAPHQLEAKGEPLPLPPEWLHRARRDSAP